MEIDGDHLVRGSGGAEEEGRREVAPVDGRSPWPWEKEKPQQRSSGDHLARPQCLACHVLGEGTPNAKS